MAVLERGSPFSFSILCLSLIICFCFPTAATFNSEAVGLAAGSVERWLIQLHSELTLFDHRNTGLEKNLTGTPFVNIEMVDTESLTSELAANIQDFLSDKRKALSDIVYHLETATTTYLWNEDLNLNTTHPLLMKDLDPTNATHCLTPDPRLGVPTRRNVSGIHLPLEVYEGWLWANIMQHREQDPQILNGVQWSSTVDQKFQDNAEADPSLMWQYFAAQTGFMRVYPATSWYVPPNLIDLYDARLRQWYVQGSVPPKDMIILMDRSGSVHGQTFAIMKWAVKTLIDTLGENDFVNVAAFNSTTEWVNNCNYCEINRTNEDDGDGKRNGLCSQPLVQAATSNKKLLYNAIDALEDGGMASYSNALTFAYNAFKQFEGTREEGEGANCIKTIMLFSDGGTEWPEKVVKTFRSDNYTKSVRIFTFAVGPHPIPTAVLKQMACSTGGKYAVITTRSSVRTKIQESYNSLLSPAPAVSGSQPYQYTTVYSSAVTEELTLSITQPVYNNSDYLNTSYLVGVAGVDVPLRSLRDLTPYQSLDPNAYTFLLNHNGFLVLHPSLKKQLSYFSGSPHIDLVDVEEDTPKMHDIRTSMIDRRHDTVNVTRGWLRVDDHHWLANSNVQISFTAIPKTRYSVGVVTVKNDELGELVVRDQDTSMMTPLNFSTMLIAPWPYCPHRHPPSDPSELTRLMEDIWKKEQGCRNSLVEGLLWSQSWTDDLFESWRNNLPQDVIGRAVFTRFGLTRFYPGSQRESVEKWRDPWKNTALRRGGVTRGLSVIPHTDGAFISTPVFVKKSGREALAAVVGVNVTSRRLREDLRKHLAFFDLDKYVVLLVDDGGFIVSATSTELHGLKLQGEFIGELEYPLIDTLVNLGVYGQETFIDVQALCPVGQEYTVSAGCRPPSLLTLFITFIKNMVGCVQYCTCLIYSFMLAVIMPGVDGWTEWGMTQMGGLEACQMEHTIYHFDDNDNKREIMAGSLACNNHTVEFAVKRLPSINAALVWLEISVVTDGGCGVLSSLPGVVPRRVNTIDPCGYKGRYRRRPPTCLVSNITVGELGCSRSSGSVCSSLTLTLIMFISSVGINKYHSS
ncbi:hypothetical protein Pmani_018995 [Petrolisthes manimaculis]|uniref:VWFA domain-containing protein n=1 Tax=Petrolisthes manimaculis TaxID=1843537 RepID=A0AAE1PJ18_9EUCA|nr:hypothetical protein Pmani_018995 [Petrolisthes manimaculis]